MRKQDAIRECRETRGLTVKEAAKIFNVSVAAWHFWEAGDRNILGRNWKPMALAWPELRGLIDR